MIELADDHKADWVPRSGNGAGAITTGNWITHAGANPGMDARKQ